MIDVGSRSGKGIIYGKVTIWSEGSETLGDMRKELSATIKELGYPELSDKLDELNDNLGEGADVSDEGPSEEVLVEDEKEKEKEVSSPWMRAARRKNG